MPQFRTLSLLPLIGLAAGILPGQMAKDPGVRGAAPGAGGPLSGLSASELAFFFAGQKTFEEVDDVSHGLGPGFNLDSCSGCHSQPSIGGSSPAINPQIAAAVRNGAANKIPSFITQDGPVRIARFRVKPGTNMPDGGVYPLFTIAGRADAPGCSASQPDFAAALAANNIAFRIPTPVFGAGLIEAIPDSAILANKAANAGLKQQLGISGHENTNGNDGTITRFGWKAQNKSLAIFAGEAYNVEMGVTNDLFPNERRETEGCSGGSMQDSVHFEESLGTASVSDTLQFAIFMRYLEAPLPAPDSASTSRGRQQFNSIGCALCHTPSLNTGKSSSAALSNQPVNLYSDLLVHRMGPVLSDGIGQGSAGPDEFRSAPLWGLGQRIFFLHDGRTNDLRRVIELHKSGDPRMRPSEPSAVVDRFNALPEPVKQDLLDFLRSL